MLYQAVVASQMSGGALYAAQYVSKFQAAAAIARNEAAFWQAEANEIDPEWYETKREAAVQGAKDDNQYFALNDGVDSVIREAYELKSEREKKAAELRRAAEDFEGFSRLIDSLAKATAKCWAGRALIPEGP